MTSVGETEFNSDCIDKQIASSHKTRTAANCCQLTTTIPKMFIVLHANVTLYILIAGSFALDSHIGINVFIILYEVAQTATEVQCYRM